MKRKAVFLSLKIQCFSDTNINGLKGFLLYSGTCSLHWRVLL